MTVNMPLGYISSAPNTLRPTTNLGFIIIFAWNKQIRVKPASKSPAGKTISRMDIPEEEWNKYGLVPPIPEV